MAKFEVYGFIGLKVYFIRAITITQMLYLANLKSNFKFTQI